MRLIFVLFILASSTPYAGASLSFQLSVRPDGKSCPFGDNKNLKLTDTTLADSGDITAVKLRGVHDDYTNTKVEKRIIKDSGESEVTEVTTFGKDAGHPVVFDYYAIDFTFTPDGARKFNDTWSKNLGKYVTLVLDGKPSQSVCINSTWIMQKPFPPLVSLSLGTGETKVAADKLFKRIQSNITVQ